MKKEKKQRIISMVILMLVLTFGCIGIYAAANRQNGAYCVITADGAEVCRLSLAQNTTERIETADGFNLIEVSDGTVSVKEADCPNQICVHTRPISKEGQVISCLPHGLIITIHAPQKEVDAVAY